MPTFFYEVLDNGYYYAPVHVTSASYPTSHNYKLKYASSNYWSFYLDGSYLCSVSNPALSRGWPEAQAERHSSSDNNYAHFSTLSRKISTSESWADWSDLRNYLDNDPDFDCLEISETEFYSN